MTDNKTPVWLDCDPGHDDAMAILLALFNPQVELVGISTVAGNMPVTHTTKNAAQILNIVGCLNKVPIVSGAAEPLLRPAKFCPEIHGETGLDGYELPPLPADFDATKDGAAVNVMFDSITAAEKKYQKTVVLVATGSLTNVAILLKVHPSIKDSLSQIVLMGGAIGLGNTHPAAEFNIEVDPEAAAIVFNSKVKIVMVPLEVTHTALVTPKILEQIQQCKSKFGELVVGLLLFFATTYNDVFGMPDPPLHDPCAIAYVINPEMFQSTLCRVNIETCSPLCAGRTVCDLMNVRKVPEEQKNVWVCTRMDVDKFWQLMLDALYKANDASII